MPISVMGTGRSPAWSFLSGLMPSAQWMVACRSGTEMDRSSIFIANSLVTPMACPFLSPPPAVTTLNEPE